MRAGQVLLLLSLLLVGCGSGVHEKGFTADDRDAVLEQSRFLFLVNQFRSRSRACGEVTYPAAPPLRGSTPLNRAALNHSEQMAEARSLNHLSADGSRFADRARQAGYEGCPQAENIAWNTSGSPDVARAFRQWRDSPSHCRILMDASANELGFGYAEGLAPSTDSRGYYYTLVTGDSNCR